MFSTYIVYYRQNSTATSIETHNIDTLLLYIPVWSALLVRILQFLSDSIPFSNLRVSQFNHHQQ